MFTSHSIHSAHVIHSSFWQCHTTVVAVSRQRPGIILAAVRHRSGSVPPPTSSWQRPRIVLAVSHHRPGSARHRAGSVPASFWQCPPSSWQCPGFVLAASHQCPCIGMAASPHRCGSAPARRICNCRPAFGSLAGGLAGQTAGVAIAGPPLGAWPAAWPDFLSDRIVESLGNSVTQKPRHSTTRRLKNPISNFPNGPNRAVLEIGNWVFELPSCWVTGFLSDRVSE